MGWRRGQSSPSISHWLRWPQKSPNFLFATKMVFPKSVEFMNSGTQEWRFAWARRQRSPAMLWTDEIHFAPPFRNPGMSRFPCKYEPTMASHGFPVAQDFVHPQCVLFEQWIAVGKWKGSARSIVQILQLSAVCFFPFPLKPTESNTYSEAIGSLWLSAPPPKTRHWRSGSLFRSSGLGKTRPGTDLKH